MSDFIAMCERLGKKRIEIAGQCQSSEDWEAKWPKTKHPYPFEWGTCWQAVAEFTVKNLEAEVGFFLDMLGFQAKATWQDHVMIMTPDGDYTFTLVRSKDGKHADPETLNLQFMLGNIETATSELKERGVELLSELAPEGGDESPMRTSEFVTPSGYRIKLWGFIGSDSQQSLAADGEDAAAEG